MNKEETCEVLRRAGVAFELTEHPAVFNMAELAAVPLPYPEAVAKNLFVCDDKKRSYHLITVAGDKRVDLKAFRRAHGLRALSLAPEAELTALLGLTAGSVTPLGLLNDRAHRVTFWLDEAFLAGAGRIGVHPNDNTATVWLRAADLLELLRAHGCEVHLTAL